MENDTAADWLLDYAEGEVSLRGTLEAALEGSVDEPLDGFLADQALAAVALVAAAAGGEGSDAAARWGDLLREDDAQCGALAPLACKALVRIAASESAELWEGDLDMWGELDALAEGLGCKPLEGGPERGVEAAESSTDLRAIREDLRATGRAITARLKAAHKVGDRPAFDLAVGELFAAMFMAMHKAGEEVAESALRLPPEEMAGLVDKLDLWSMAGPRRGGFGTFVSMMVSEALSGLGRTD